jgi:hypothetical protein
MGASVSMPWPTVTRLATPLAREEIVGMVWALAGERLIPANSWPMQIAIESLEERVPSDGRVSRALEAWPAGVTSRGRRRPNIDAMLRSLALQGLLSVEGRGWDAGYRPTKGWLDHGALALSSLSRPERDAVGIAAQRLIASLTIWSKKSRTALSDKSVTS